MAFDIKTAKNYKIVIKSLSIFVGCIFINLGAMITLPLGSDIQINIQFIIVTFIGVFVGARLGVIAVISYLLLGLIRCPFFLYNDSGLSFFTSSFGGYQLGLIPCVIISGMASSMILVSNSIPIIKSTQSIFKQCLFSQCIFFLMGTFIFYAGNTNHYTFSKSLSIGFIPFIPLLILNSLFIAFTYKYFFNCIVKKITFANRNY